MQTTGSAARSIVIIGASADRSKYGNKAVRAYIKQGYTVYPVNLREAEIEGQKAYPSVSDVPAGAAEEASFYVPPQVGLSLVEDVARNGIKRIWLNPGSESDELIAKAGELGLETIVACSIVGVGVEPDEL